MQDTIDIQQRNSILEELYSCPKFNECINKMEPRDMREDLKSMVMLIVIEKGSKFIIDTHRKNELSYYAIRVVLNCVMRNGSEFNKKYRTRRENSDENIEKNFIYKKAFEDVYESKEAARIPDQVLNGRVVKEASEEPILEMLDRIKKLAYETNPNYIEEIMESVNWYRQYMISLFMKLGNYDKMVKETGIPKFSCFTAVREGLQGLQKHFGLQVTKNTNRNKLTIKKCLSPVLP